MKLFTLLVFLFSRGVLAISSEDAINKELSHHKDEIDYCYKESGDNRKGTIVFSWDVNDKGEVPWTQYSVKSTLRNLEIAECFKSRITNIKFPPAPKGRTVRITHIFDYSK